MKKKTLPVDIDDLEVLVLDCQATGANPETALLLEIGWARTRTSDPAAPGGFGDSPGESHLVRVPGEAEIPRRVTRITGIKAEDLESGLPLAVIWEKLGSAARQIAKANRLDLCPAVIHYARFEERFLRYLHRQYGAGEPFPFDIICTHKAMRRLLPNLPRKGLRAAAGYLGHSVPEPRRTAHHIAAAAFIWQRVVPLLREKKIRTLEQLKEWLEKPPEKPAAPGIDYPMEASLRLNLPQKPGIYRMFRSNGDLLYIGKATSLKHRVNSYFHKKKRSSYPGNTLEMLTQAAHLETVVTGSALEAALLETDEIKKHSPPYNVALRRREREIVFFSRDLRECSREPGGSHPVGPLPSAASLAAFAAAGAFLGGGLTGANSGGPDLPSLVLGVRPEFAPAMECFLQGAEIFRQRHDYLLKIPAGEPLIKNLVRLGKELRRQKLEEAEVAEPEPGTGDGNGKAGGESGNNGAEEVEEERTRTWTPESTAGVMEGVLRFGAHLLRRARWYCLLSESSLAWVTGKTAGGQPRLLVLRGGAAVRREDIAPAQEIPSPPGYRLTFAGRQKNFDIMTYDRLRVLTTEMRRLVSDENDRQVRLCLRPGIVLGRGQLRELLRWV